MANKHNNEEKNAVENINEHLTSATSFIQEKKNIIIWITGALVVVVALILGYLYGIRKPNIDKSWEEYSKVEIQAQGNDSISLAAYKKIADKYSDGAGDIAALQAGLILYNQKKYDEAVKYLKKADIAEPVLHASVTRLIGDCYVNLKKYSDALSYFDKAISQADENPQLVPAILMKEANIYEAQKKYSDALAVYERIQKEYPEFNYGLGMDAYIARAKARLGK